MRENFRRTHVVLIWLYIGAEPYKVEYRCFMSVGYGSYTAGSGGYAGYIVQLELGNKGKTKC